MLQIKRLYVTHQEIIHYTSIDYMLHIKRLYVTHKEIIRYT
jgi:hypothetical protein